MSAWTTFLTPPMLCPTVNVEYPCGWRLANPQVVGSQLTVVGGEPTKCGWAQEGGGCP